MGLLMVDQRSFAAIRILTSWTGVVLAPRLPSLLVVVVPVVA